MNEIIKQLESLRYKITKLKEPDGITCGEMSSLSQSIDIMSAVNKTIIDISAEIEKDMESNGKYSNYSSGLENSLKILKKNLKEVEDSYGF